MSRLLSSAAVVCSLWIMVLVGGLQGFQLLAFSAPQSVSDERELSEEEIRQIKTAERFLDVLLKNPRFGTALDRVYGHHVEFGSLDAFLTSLKQRAESEQDSGALWMVLGMFESQRGNDGAAVDALEKADQLRPQDALASFYLGQAQLRIGRSEEAIASFERALTRQPARADLLDIFQTLGRVHQRAQRTEQAMEVWQRLEKLFPDDPRVLEQIAVTLTEEGQSGLALPRYQKLAGMVRDDYRRVMYRIAAAELSIKLGQRFEGLKAFEKMLEELNPESWLFRDVRRRIDDVFLRSGDQDSLVKYYENWLVSHPEDVEGMARLAKFLASSARVPEAIQWMEKALKRAPSRADLRRSFIDQLLEDHRVADALQQYQELIKAAPNHPDYLRDWGKLVLRNRDLPEEDRKQEAARIWKRILDSRPNDALTVSQVADLLRQHKILDQAESLYRRAVELAPTEPQYREYLGEFLHLQGRSEEALRIWAGIAEVGRRTPDNIIRLAEVYNAFGFSDQAINEISEAVKLSPKDFNLRIRAADYYLKAAKYKEAMALVQAAQELAANDDERESVLQQRIEVLQASQQLDIAADEQLRTLRGKGDATAADWYVAARYLEASRRWPDATDAVDQAIKLDPKSIPALGLAARIAETSGDYGRAARMNRTLAEIDRRSRSDHLISVSRLESQLGRADEAMKAAQELIVAAPGNTDNYEFYAQTCFRFGRIEEGLNALRKAVRLNPHAPHLMLALAAALADQLRTDEAIEVYWRAFEKSDELEDKVSLTMKLTLLYQQINQLDKLFDRLERDRRDEEKRRTITICLAQAWQTSGDLGAARQELESLLSQDTRDTQLLNQLAKLCEVAADLDAAIEYQRQLVAIAPGQETEFPLAQMLMNSGQIDEAREILVKLTRREEDPVKQIRAIDSLLTQSNFESVISVIEPLLAQNRDDWELLYREGVAWAGLDKAEEAINRFQRILALRLPFDSLGRSAAERFKQAQAKAKSDILRGIDTIAPQKQTPLAMVGVVSQVQSATGLIHDNRSVARNQPSPVWVPEAFGLARMAAFGWLMKFENEGKFAVQFAGDPPPSSEAKDAVADGVAAMKKSFGSMFEAARQAAERENATADAMYDWLYVAYLKNDYPTIFDIARRMARTGGREEQQFFLSTLKLRHSDLNQVGGNRSPTSDANRRPLSPEDLQLVRTCYAQLSDRGKSIDLNAIYGGNVVYDSSGQAYLLVGGTYVQLPGVFRPQQGYLSTLIDELRLAGENEEALELIRQQVNDATTVAELNGALALLLAEERYDEMPPMLERWEQAALKQISETPVTVPARGASRSTAQTQQANVLSNVQSTVQRWLAKLAEIEENALMLTVLDRCLTVAEAEARHRKLVLASQKYRVPTIGLNPVPQGYVSFYSGKKQVGQSLNFPPVNLWIDSTTCSLLYQVHDGLKRNDALSDLSEWLRKRLEPVLTDESSRDRLICSHLYLAAALWWAEEQDAAVEQMAQAARLAADDLSMQLSLASTFETRGEFDEALSLLEKIVPRDQKVLQAVELRILKLAERVGDSRRARISAERLFGLRLDSQTQLSLVTHMRRLGLGEMADAILARAGRTSSNQLSSLASLMMLYEGQGKTEQATQLAHQLLRRTPTSINVMATIGRNPLSIRTQESNIRTQALQVLHRSGDLKLLIEQAEKRLHRSPDSVLTIQQLIEFYTQTNQRDEIRRLIEQGLQVRPDSPILRLQFAKYLEQSGQFHEACDQYLELLKIRPNWLFEELNQIDVVFSQAKRKADLAEAISKFDPKQVSQPYFLIKTSTSLLANDQTFELGMNLLERVFEAFPTYRKYVLQRDINPNVWKNHRFYEYAQRTALPSPLDIASNPWFGLDQIDSFGVNGEINVFFHRMLQATRSVDKLSDLELSIHAMLEKQPNWYGGQVMLALIEFATERNQNAQTRLKELLKLENVFMAMPYEVCWVIGQELDRFDETRDLALTLFERSISAPKSPSTGQMHRSQLTRMTEALIRVGRSHEAKDIILKYLSSAMYDYDADYSSYQRIENSIWAAQKFKEMEFPVDALKLYQGLLRQPDVLKAAAKWRGGGTDYYPKAVHQGIKRVFDSVTEKNVDDVLAQLLSVPEKLKPGAPSMDLMFTVPDTQNLSNREIGSAFVDLIKALSKVPEFAQRITDRLHKLASQHPRDLSVAVLSAAWQLETNAESDEAKSAVKKLATLVVEQPLEPIPVGRRPNSRQRQEAASVLPVWLIARQCLARQDLRDDGVVLAEFCRTAAARQMSFQESAAILFEWGKILLKAGQREEAQARWSELLDVATQRPGGRSVALPPKTSLRSGVHPVLLWSFSPFTAAPVLLAVLQPPTARQPGTEATVSEPGTAEQKPDQGQAGGVPSQQIPPLTMSQFRTVMFVARHAAEHGMFELSRRAVVESILGGIPVPDPEDEASSGLVMQSLNSFSKPSSFSSLEAGRAGENEVNSSLETVVQIWLRNETVPIQEVYEVLSMLVFPASHPEEIRMYVAATDFSAARISCLAESLILAALKADRMNDLKSSIAHRQSFPAARVPATAFQLLIDLYQNSVNLTSEQLAIFDAQSLKGLSSQDRLIVFLAALRAFEKPELQPKCIAVLQHLMQTEIAQNLELGGKLPSMVHRYLVQHGGAQEVVDWFNQLLASRQAASGEYVEDYALYLQQKDLIELAQQAASVGLGYVAQDYLGRAIDFHVTQYGRPVFGPALSMVVRQLRSLPAEERYSRWLKWTLPVDGRQSFRVLHEGIVPTFVPAIFASQPIPLETQLRDGMASNFTELVDAAKQCNRLDELQMLVEPLVAAKEKSADILLALILIARDDVEAGTPLINSLLTRFTKKAQQESSESDSNRVRQGPPLDDYLVFRGCLQSKAFVHLCDERLPQFRDYLQVFPTSPSSQVNMDWATRVTSPARSNENSPSARWAHWLPVYEREHGARTQPWWTVHHDQILSLNGYGGNNLLYRYPLTGKKLTVSIDCFAGRGAASNASFGGVLVKALGSPNNAMIDTLSGGEQLYRQMLVNRTGSSFNRVLIEVDESVVRHWINNQMVYEEPRSLTSPWLVLNSDGRRLSAFRNLRISGDVAIPKKVSLLFSDQMDGWRCTAFNETQPKKRLMKETPTSEYEYDYVSVSQRNEPTEFDWNASNGTLSAMAIPSAPSDSQSWIYYQRPLASGESFEYEFYYRPGLTVAHPTIGQIALLLEPENVVSHWIATMQDQQVYAISPTNALVETTIRRGPAKLPLKPDDWNTVQLELRGDVALVTLNGILLCERPMEPELSRRVGFFRYKRQACQIRNVVLRGNWPETAPVGQEAMKLDQPISSESILNVAEIVDDVTTAHLAAEVVATARSMSPDTAYNYLLDWVLPTATHKDIRLYYSQAPPPASSTGVPRDDLGVGYIVSPAVELIRLAIQLNRTASLLKSIDPYAAGTPSQQHAALAFRTLLALETNDDATIETGLKEIWRRVTESSPGAATARRRGGEFLVAWRAAQHPKFWSIGSDLARRLRDLENNFDTGAGDVNFRRQVNVLAGSIERMARKTADPSSPTGGAQPQQWTQVPYLKPEHRWAGFRTSTWEVTKGCAQHDPADTWNQLFFQSPLRGKFEIVANRTTHNYQEMSITWGMHCVEPTSDLKGVRVTKLMHSSKEIRTPIQLAYWDQIAEFRIVVDGRKVTTWVNGVQIHEQKFDRPPDPWLLLQSNNPIDYGRVSNLRILGTPEIPEEIDLLNIAGLASWRADIYGEWFRTDEDGPVQSETPPWRLNRDELLGELIQTKGGHRESLIMYQRPMLEDGDIEFETWYDPGVFEVHPALGRNAFLLHPDGVQRHRLTDGQYEIGDLRPDNRESIPGAAATVPLKSKDWNQVRLSLRGDLLTIIVNGQEVATVRIHEEANTRHFGLFRYSNLTRARVRKVVYRGQWPKQLPPLELQQLAAPIDGPQLENAMVVMDADLSRSIDELREQNLVLHGPVNRRNTLGKGLQLFLFDSKGDQGDPEDPGITYTQPIKANCEVIVAFDEMNISPTRSGDGASLVLELVLDDPQNTRVECGVSMDRTEQLLFRSRIQRNDAVGSRHAIDERIVRPGHASGQLRLIRRGGQVDCYAAPEGSNDFIHLNSLTVGDAKILAIACNARCSNDQETLDVILRRLTIRQEASQKNTGLGNH